MTVSHRSSLSKHFIKCFTNPVFEWYSRDLFWDELEKFGCDNISDASKEMFLDCLATVNEVFRTHKNACEKRGLEPKQGPQNFADRLTTKIDYCGARPQIF